MRYGTFCSRVFLGAAALCWFSFLSKVPAADQEVAPANRNTLLLTLIERVMSDDPAFRVQLAELVGGVEADEVKSLRESFGQFSQGLFIAVVLVYLVMVAQFSSFIDPLVILLTVPLGFIGVAALLVLTGTNLSIMAFMGIIMMVGIVVEYSIVLVDFANQRLADGLSVREAIIDATKVRLRPVLMTSLTTWLALLPMAIGLGGGDANIPLARAIIGGVLGATILSLVVVPCLYVMLKPQPRPAAT